MTTTRSTVVHDTFVIERTYDASVSDVFGAWADPKRKAHWFAGSVDALESGYELDFRVGGREVNRGGPPGGAVYRYESRFCDIVPDQRIVSTYEMYADDERLSVSVATIEFEGDESATRLVLTEQGVFLDGLDTSGQREQVHAPSSNRWRPAWAQAIPECARRRPAQRAVSAVSASSTSRSVV